MPLPIPTAPLFELEVPSTGKKIVCRPFLTKEEKILLMALESDDEKQILLAIKETLKNCIRTKIKIDDLAVFDVEYIFLNIRSRAIGETIELKLTCPDDNTTQVDVKIPIENIKVTKPENHSSEIKIDDTYIVKMKYPNIDSVFGNNLDNTDDALKIIAKHISQIITEDEVYDCSQFTLKEINEFIENLPFKQFKKIEMFFDDMPKLQHKINLRNPNTNVESEVVIEGLYNFFG